jgi:hypothetical protein
MYDVKQVNPAEWSSPPWEARLLDKPDVGRIVMGRGAVNQKGPQAAFLAALHAIRAAGKPKKGPLPCLCRGAVERVRRGGESDQQNRKNPAFRAQKLGVLLDKRQSAQCQTKRSICNLL